MNKKIYLPPYAKKQLETSDDASKWAKPIPFREKPCQGFNLEVILGEDTLELGVDFILEDNLYYPDRDQDLEGTIETIKKVKTNPKTKEYKEKNYGSDDFDKHYSSELTIDDFAKPLFDKQNPVRRSINIRKKKEKVIEGVTSTNKYNEVGYTYCLFDGMLYMNYWDKIEKKNVRLFKEIITSVEDFEKCLKKADKEISKYLS